MLKKGVAKMTATEILKELTQAGCKVTLDGERIKVSGNLTDELRTLIREHKPLLIMELQRREDAFHIMFQKAVDAISKHYATGSLDWLELYHPDKYAELCRLHDELEKVWQTQDEALFREALKQWYVAHIETMKLFRKNEGWLSTANRKLASQGFCVLKDSLSNEYFLIVNNDSVSVPDKCRKYPKYTVNEINEFPEVSRDAFVRSHTIKKAFKAKHIENAEGWPWQ